VESVIRHQRVASDRVRPSRLAVRLAVKISVDLRMHLGADLPENRTAGVPLGAGVADGLDQVQAAQGTEID
jgi:hypothetical protein